MDQKTKHFVMHYLGQNRGAMGASVGLSVVSVLCGFVPYFVVYGLFASFLHQKISAAVILTLGLCAAAGYLGKTCFFEWSTVLSHRTAYTVLARIRSDVSDKFLKMPLGDVQDQPIGTTKNLLIDQVETMELPLAHLIPEGIADMLAPAGVFLVLMWVHPLMALASLVSFVLGMAASAPMMAGMNKNYDAYMRSSNAMNSTIVEYLEGIEVIKTFNQGEASYGKFTKVIESFRELTLRWFRSTWVGGNLMMTIMPSTMLGVLPVGLWLYLRGSMTPEELVFSMVLSLALIAPIMGISTYMNSLKMIQYAVKDLSEVMDQPELPDAAEPVALSGYDLEFDHVGFSYRKEVGRKVLDDLSFRIPEGSFTALVGPSGGGKSTVAKLISRFWEVGEGRILLGGRDIRTIPLEQLSHCISYVAQENELFNTSILENIRLGNPDASDEEVHAAARAACCDSFIRELEHGYDTMAGEAGSRLSGGEKQRIAIARMILRNAPVVVLDEATAFTDPENEAHIQEAIANLARGKTLLVIAHRLSTVCHADRILLLSDGRLEAAGTHRELLRDSAHYRAMWNAHIGARSQSVQGGM